MNIMNTRTIKAFSLFLLILAGTFNFEGQAIAETWKNEDDLDTVNNFYWAGQGWPFNETVNIKDSLVGSHVGRVVLDRHGEESGWLTNPFAGPYPGRYVIVSMWGSKVEGCFVKMIVQSSPVSGQADIQGLVPVKLQIGLGQKILKLTPSSTTEARNYTGKYQYTEYQNDIKYERSSTWYGAENLFAVDDYAANLLRNAPDGNIKIRITFANGDTKVFPVGKDNVKKWEKTFGFNPTCLPPARNK